MIHAIMVDVDGVLINGRPADGRPWASEIEADLGISNADLNREFFGPYWSDIIVGHSGLAEQLKLALARLTPSVPHEDLIAYWFASDARLNRPLLEALAQLRERGTKVFLATNQEHLRSAYLMDQLGLGPHVDGIYYSAALGSHKPERDFFEQTAALSGFAPEQLLLIDDTPANVVAARQLGWNAVLWTAGSSLSAELVKLQAEGVNLAPPS
ncbi:HAD family phosphatase [Pseudomonas sp. D6002]|uniref:HAD family hydrolase n=1 Tax=unclassified Pseudomonas TaxID=196821 RepID=UPI0015A1C7D1|nr:MULTISPECIES: HAD family phosphatase [unclassified Pseudomonas]NVZ94394.1 HAD family phosphatase [Pseudomonas sp. B6001]NWB16529.1 HAD family phosphatase [Pseudomonas sp. D6002]